MNTYDEELFKVILKATQSRSKAERIIQRYFSDKIILVWTTEDVHRAANEREVALTEREAMTVLETLHHQHDKQLGLCWGDLTNHIESRVLGRKLTKREVSRFVKNDALTIRR